jgi:ubiquinone biosynthesis protein COQ9
LNNTVNGVQIECNYTNVRDSYSNRKKFAAALVAVVKNYLLVHQNINFNNCGVTNDVENTALSKNTFSIFPNPATDFIKFFSDEIDNNAALTITNIFGEIVLKTTQQTKLDVSFLPRGVYWVQTIDANKNCCTKMLLLSK